MGTIAAVGSPGLAEVRVLRCQRTQIEPCHIKRGGRALATEHEGKYPTTVAQMIEYSNLKGTATNSTKNVASKIVLGPYLDEIPPLPVGSKKGATGIHVSSMAIHTPPQGGPAAAGGTIPRHM